MGKSVFKEVIDEFRNSGDLKRQTIIDLSDWFFDADSETGQEAMSGHTCQVKVLKLGARPKTSFINFDPANKDIRIALEKMYKVFDNLVQE